MNNTIIYVARPGEDGIYKPLPVNEPQSGEPWYTSVMACQEACDVWNRKS